MSESTDQRAFRIGAASALLLALCLACGLPDPSQAEQLNAATALFDEGRYAEAELSYLEYTEAWPDDPRGYSSLAFTLLELDRVDEAEAAFVAAQDAGATDSDTYLGLGRVARERGQDAVAMQHYRRGLEISPNDAEIMGSMLVLECLEGNYAEAVRLGERAQAITPRSPRLSANLSVAYHYVGNREGRDRAFQNAVDNGYDNAASLQAVFRGEQVVGPGSNAQVLPADPDEADMIRAARAFAERRYPDAARILEPLTTRRPDLSRAWTTYGFTLLRLERVDDAERTFRRAEALDPTFADVWLGLGRVHAERGELEEAMVEYERALQINPDDAQVLSSMVSISCIRGEYDESVQLGERARQHAPRDPTVAANLSVAYHYVGNAQRRDESYRQALELGYDAGPRLLEIFSGETQVGPGSEREAPPYVE